MALKLVPRKILRIGRSSLITLPLDWILHHQLKKHDMINVTVNNEGMLVLEPQKKNVQD